MEHKLGREKTLTMSEIMTPDMANFTGNVHGGYILGLLDKVAYACAARYSGLRMVTLSVDTVFFKEPVHVGELVICYACVNYVGTTSLEVGVKIIAENIQTAVKRHTNTCYFTMVAVDENFKPIPLPPLVLETELDKWRFEEAKLRKQLRFDLQRGQEKLKSERDPKPKP